MSGTATPPGSSNLVSAAWLREHLADVVVLDATIARGTDAQGRTTYLDGRAVHAAGHLPGALFADVVGAFSAAGARLPLTRPSAGELGAAARELGIHPDSQVVVYDGLSGAWAARIWWLLRTAGHRHVRVLDGGRAAWEGPLETGEVPPPGGGTWVPEPRADVWVDREGVQRIVAGERPGTLVCALREPDYAAGHIPGSGNTPYNDLLDGGLLDRDRAAAAAEDLSGPLVLYCGGGINAAGLALALAEVGREDVALYDGSLTEWRADELPLAR